MKKNILFVWIILTLTSGSLMSINAPISTVANITPAGSTATVPVTAVNFTNIGSFDLVLLYNPAFFTVTSVTKGPLLGGSLTVNLTVPGTISLGWYTVPGKTLADNSVIFNIAITNFTGCTSAITWYDVGDACDWFAPDFITELNDFPTSTYYINGSVIGTDITPPVLHNVPANVTVNCDAIPSVGMPTATDNCDPNPVVHYLGQVSTQDPNPLLLTHYSYTLTRSWNATDASNNTSPTSYQVITVHDVTGPVFTNIPSNVTVNCDAIPGVGTPIASDNCDPNPVIHYLGQVSTQNSNPLLIGYYSYSITRTWNATDVSGNTSLTGTQVITVHDVTGPVFVYVPPAVTVDCDAIPSVGTPTASDNCDPNPVVHYLGQVSTQDPNALLIGHYSYTITRTWNATDVSGNTGPTGTQVITVYDVTPPVLGNIPATTSVQCSSIPSPGTPTAADNCDPNPVVHYLGQVSTQDPNALLIGHYSYTITRSWNATDVSGNTSATGTQVITVSDNTPPTLTCPSVSNMYDRNNGCTWVGSGLVPGLTDNCDPAPVLSYAINGSPTYTAGNANGYPFPGGATTVTYKAVDVAGNSSTCSFVINVRQITLSGHISYNNPVATKMNYVGITLQQSGFADLATTTDANGNYMFADVCLGSWNVIFNTDIAGHVKTAGGINATDAAVLNYWGTGSHSYPIQKVQFYAGDVVTDNENNSADASRILQYFVTMGNPPWYNPPCCLRSAWTFWTTGTQNDMISANPPSPNFSAIIPAVTVAANSVALTQNFLALSTGDYDGSFIPGTAKSASRSLQLTIGPTRFVKTGEEFELPVYCGSAFNIGAVSLIMHFPEDKIEILGVAMSGENNSPLMFNVQDNELRIGWTSPDVISIEAGSKLLILKVKLTSSLEKNEILRFTLAADPLNELADGMGGVIPDAVLNMEGIGSYDPGTNPGEALRFENYPNPFNGTTTLAYSLPAEGDVTIELRDMTGLLVKAFPGKEQQSAVDYKVILDANGIPAGIYTATLKLTTSTGELITKTIKIVKTY